MTHHIRHIYFKKVLFCPAWLLLLFVLSLMTGCTSIGPSSIKKDRFDYVIAISESYKRQMLLNLLKTRYVDAPVFMEVDSVISQYAIEAELGIEIAPSESDDNLLLGKGKYTDRPTISYTPITGEKYSRSLLTPLPLSSIFLLLQSGYPIDSIFRICAQSINGIENRRSSAFSMRDADPRFSEVLALMRELQLNGSLYYRVEVISDKAEIVLGFKSTKESTTPTKLAELKHLLDIEPNINQYIVVFDVRPTSKAEIGVISRGMMQIMIEYAADIEVPEGDVEEGRVMSTTGNDTFPTPLIKVYHGNAKPNNAHAAVYYRERWYWVDDRDIYSKTTLQFLMVLFSLTERGVSGNLAPVITVPTY